MRLYSHLASEEADLRADQRHGLEGLVGTRVGVDSKVRRDAVPLVGMRSRHSLLSTALRESTESSRPFRPGVRPRMQMRLG